MHVGHWLCQQHAHDALHSIVVYVPLLYPVQACDLINQLAKKLVSSLAVYLMACVKPRSKEQNLLPT